MAALLYRMARWPLCYAEVPDGPLVCYAKGPDDNVIQKGQMALYERIRRPCYTKRPGAHVIQKHQMSLLCKGPAGWALST